MQRDAPAHPHQPRVPQAPNTASACHSCLWRALCVCLCAWFSVCQGARGVLVVPLSACIDKWRLGAVIVRPCVRWAGPAVVAGHRQWCVCVLICVLSYYDSGWRRNGQRPQLRGRQMKTHAWLVWPQHRHDTRSRVWQSEHEEHTGL